MADAANPSLRDQRKNLSAEHKRSSKWICPACFRGHHLDSRALSKETRLQPADEVCVAKHRVMFLLNSRIGCCSSTSFRENILRKTQAFFTSGPAAPLKKLHR